MLSCFELKQSPSQPDSKSFRICIVAEDKSILCNRENWAIGVSIRDWVHKPKVVSKLSPVDSGAMDVVEVPVDSESHNVSVAGSNLTLLHNSDQFTCVING